MCRKKQTALSEKEGLFIILFSIILISAISSVRIVGIRLVGIGWIWIRIGVRVGIVIVTKWNYDWKEKINVSSATPPYYRVRLVLRDRLVVLLITILCLRVMLIRLHCAICTPLHVCMCSSSIRDRSPGGELSGQNWALGQKQKGKSWMWLFPQYKVIWNIK